YPLSGGGLELDLLEACYLAETGRLEVVGEGATLTFPEIVTRAASACEDFEIRYIVYRDIRQRGYVVKEGTGEFDFRVFPRGGTPTNSQTKHWVSAIAERSLFDIASFLEDLERSERMRKELLLAIVDEEGDITYYKASTSSPKGKGADREKDQPVEAILLEDRVLVLDEGEAQRLYEHGFYGKKIGKTLQLSLIETAHLMEAGRLLLRLVFTGRRVSMRGLVRRAMKIQPDFELRLRTYSDLRGRGLVVKTGFKYGSHFRVYESDPETHHAKYLVHAVPEDYRTIWPEISRAVRLAHGVKKEILFGRVSEDEVEYVRLKRVRP
ncbi:MAG: tRNA-intron lyase, partial [Euryarchaeota archaeon]|nr:tRNA-intron lyase [Euryarchaeota archaeon]